MEFKHLKSYFENCEFPETLNAPDMYLSKPQLTVNLIIKQIERSILDGPPSEHAKIQKQKLYLIYKALQDKTNWNVSFEDMNKKLF